MDCVNKTSQPAEMLLIKDASQGDLDAFNQLVLAYQNFLFGVAMRILGDEDSASDAMQETMISAFQKLNAFRGGSFKHWLERIMVNACYDELRYKYRRRTIPLEWAGVDDQDMEPGLWMADPKAGPEESCESLELEHVIATSLQSLTPAYRVVLVLVDIEDHSYEEAAAVMGIPVNTVKSRLARARMKMREELLRFNDQLPARYRIGFPQEARADISFSV